MTSTEEKVCGGCKTSLPLESFSMKNTAKGTRQSHCKACQKPMKSKHYESNKATYKARSALSKKALVIRNKQFLAAYVSDKSCLHCGEKDPVVLEFDHRDPAEKENGVSVMVLGAVSVEKLQREIDKCDILCANCHRRKTAKQFGWLHHAKAEEIDVPKVFW